MGGKGKVKGRVMTKLGLRDFLEGRHPGIARADLWDIRDRASWLELSWRMGGRSVVVVFGKPYPRFLEEKVDLILGLVGRYLADQLDRGELEDSLVGYGVELRWQ